MITANVAGSSGGSGHPPPSFHTNRTTHLTPGARAWVRSHSQLNLYGGSNCELAEAAARANLNNHSSFDEESGGSVSDYAPSNVMYDLRHKSLTHRVKSYTYLLCVAGIIIGSLVLIIMAAMGKLGNQDR